MAVALGCGILTPSTRARPSHLQASLARSSGGHRASAAGLLATFCPWAFVRRVLALRLAASA